MGDERTSEATESGWTWAELEPAYRALHAAPLSEETVDGFLTRWSALSERVGEWHARLYVATTRNTADEEAERRYQHFLDEVYPASEEAEQALRQKLLASGLTPENFAVPLRQMRASAKLYRPENVPLLAQEQKLEGEYDKIIGAQTVEWEGREVPLAQLTLAYQNTDRAVRERAWRLAAERRLQDRDAINRLWQRFLTLRGHLAANAGFPEYRSFRWQQLLRFDYSPVDTLRFHQAIEEVVVPAAARVYERRRETLGVDTLRPWDLLVDPQGRPPLRPFHEVPELVAGVRSIFQRVDERFAGYFNVMIDDDLLDLANRKNKAPGGYQIDFPASRRPFIFMNAVGTQDDVETLLHEGGHAFHAFETVGLPWYAQREPGWEFAEVASMAMELLASPYLAAEQGGFYSTEDAARARLDHLEGILVFWPRMAVIDAFQHWVYAHPHQAADPQRAGEEYLALHSRFIPLVDWSGLEEVLRSDWHRIPHIHGSPFYYVEYGMAQLGAVQVWASARQDQAAAVDRYRRALSLGNTRPLPALYAAAGATFSFNAPTLRPAVKLIEGVVHDLQAA